MDNVFDRHFENKGMVGAVWLVAIDGKDIVAPCDQGDHSS